MTRRSLWALAFRQGSVWKRACRMGLTVGLLQAAINQGDMWMRGTLSTAVLVKGVVSPMVGFSLVLLSAAATFVEQHKGENHGG